MREEIVTYKTVTPEPVIGRGGPSYCRVESCIAVTREGKPYCSDHIEHSPYVMRLIQEIDRRELESALLDRGEEIPLNGSLVVEAITLLHSGGYTAARLARMLDIEPDAALSLIKLMSRKGITKMGKTERGSTTVSLVE